MSRYHLRGGVTTVCYIGEVGMIEFRTWESGCGKLGVSTVSAPIMASLPTSGEHSISNMVWGV